MFYDAGVSDLRNRIAELFVREHSIRARQKLLVGVSGGMDSMALLQLLYELALERKWRLGVVHVNHGLRGRASGVDERFVRRQAERWGISFFTEKHDVAARAKTNGISVEMAAREVRHETFVRVAKNWRCRRIALGDRC